MRLPGTSAHLTYCTNIHPGDGLDDVFEHVGSYAAAVKRAVAPAEPFSVGLRLSGRAVQELTSRARRDELRALLDVHGLYVHTLNGFPYGPFHGQPVKSEVYRPDWTERSRGAYTVGLADVLEALVPPETSGSISTVPGCFLPRASEHRRATIAHRLADAVADLWGRRSRGGPELVLALEPEPHCLLETSQDVISFLQQFMWRGPGRDRLIARTGLEPGQAERVIRTHLGACIDLCHAAVEYEDPRGCIADLSDHGVRIAKTQISAGLRIAQVTENRLAALKAFADPVYLHQVVASCQGRLVRYHDLEAAFSAWRDDPSRTTEWRVHFHVPLFRSDFEHFEGTQDFVTTALDSLKDLDVCDCFEVETYTWDVLPPRFRDRPVVEAICGELNWVLDQWTA